MGKENVQVKMKCQVDKSYPISPNGILKIIEMVLGFIEMILIGVGISPSGYSLDGSTTPSIFDLALFWASDFITLYYPALRFSVAMAVIIWILTVVMFCLILFCVPEQAGGNQIWNLIDLITNIIWVVIYVIVFILLCITCGIPTSHAWHYSPVLIVAIIFAILLLIAYILSLVFAILAKKANKLY